MLTFSNAQYLWILICGSHGTLQWRHTCDVMPLTSLVPSILSLSHQPQVADLWHLDEFGLINQLFYLNLYTDPHAPLTSFRILILLFLSFILDPCVASWLLGMIIVCNERIIFEVVTMLSKTKLRDCVLKNITVWSCS